MFVRKNLVFALLTLSGISIGCVQSKTEPAYFADLVIVYGKVTLDGNPVSGATITFIPADMSQSGGIGTGVTVISGDYDLTTPQPGSLESQPKGIVPGNYKVTITKLQMPDGSPVPEGTDDAMAMAMDAREAIPAKYSDSDKTELLVEVDHTSPFVQNFELKSE
ncbi:hypothetical protein [Rubinisphaera sp.]|uniref:hypothetical protein n=1 Tax=Rubinisphaera sp. TaxID=2024857 RepID=UPI000C0FB10B|nr:hypothetical protein [Rubinisphaera sp.]MBV12320.1 hypothetical protein [Rubinisphaera sp.]HCS54557.1 hypothetical protein [Planctomycetaceae bacterium]|tara:strand:- start:11489 stop:11980 length:492 start_codon:yes stop_codon:yes gene_type:complete